MNLYNLTNLIKDICKSQPNVAQVEVGDVYAINHKQDIEYPAMVVTQQTSFVDNINKATTYNFTIFYIDLLDSSESNLLDVQSIATVAINDVLEGIEGAGLLLADTYEAHTFKERFNDVCAGAFVNVGIIVGNETCGGEGYSLVYSVNGQSGDVWIETPDISNYYTKGETDEKIDTTSDELENDIAVLEGRVSDVETHVSDIATPTVWNVTARGELVDDTENPRIFHFRNCTYDFGSYTYNDFRDAVRGSSEKGFFINMLGNRWECITYSEDASESRIWSKFISTSTLGAYDNASLIQSSINISYVNGSFNAPSDIYFEIPVSQEQLKNMFQYDEETNTLNIVV